MKRIVAAILSLGFLLTVAMISAAADSSNQRGEWEKTVEAAKKVFDPTPAIQLVKETLGEIGE